MLFYAVLRIWIRCFFDPWIRDAGWKKIQRQGLGSGMNILDLIFEILVSFFVLKILKILCADPDPGSGSCQPWIRDGKNRIRDPR